MDEASITDYISQTFAGVDVVVASQESGAPEIAWGDSFFIYDPERSFDAQHRFPFATIVTKDYPDDVGSNLARPGVFRLNIGVSKQTFDSLITQGDYDFAQLDHLLPHPVYRRQHWVSILNPTRATFDAEVRPLLAEAYHISAGRHARV